MRTGMNVVIGAQAGSESKGKLSAYLIDKHRVDALTMASSPNAGHTVVIGDDKYVSYHIPVCAVMGGAIPILLGPTSLIQLPKLIDELNRLGIRSGRVTIHPRAAIIDEDLIQAEVSGSSLSDIGSTLQGVGAARLAKMAREGGVQFAGDPQITKQLEKAGVIVGDTTGELNQLLDEGATVLHECTQGWDLDLEHGIDPVHCTSKMINVPMAMAEMGVSPKYLGHVYGCLRPFPIRVNNRTGWSGPYTGAKEIDWATVARECNYPKGVESLAEYTTTTKLPRRVFTFSWERFNEFVKVNRPDYLCLQFANYIDWVNYGARDENQLTDATVRFMSELERYGAKVAYVGTGPEHLDMVDRGRDGNR